MAHHHHKASGKNLAITILLNVTITIAQLIGGLISGSMALISDAIHNFSDVISLIISYIANRLARVKANNKQTFGRKRSEIMAAFFNSATLIILSIFIIIKAMQRFLTSQPIKADWVIWLAVLSIAVNGLSVLFIQKDAKKSINMRSAYLHLFSDMLTSIAVLVGGLTMKYLQWYWVDPIFSIGIGIYLLYMSWQIFSTSIKILMQYTPEGIDVDEIIKEVERIDGIKNLHHIHIWQLNDHDIMFESHLDVEDNIKISEFENILSKVHSKLHEFNIEHITIQPEFIRDDNKEAIRKHH